jgi:hypothetical protein
MVRKNNLVGKEHKLSVEENIRGGQAKTPAKVLSSRINGLMNRKDLSDDQRYMFALLKDKKISDLMMELISMNLEDAGDVERRDKVIEQLKTFIATRNINLDIGAGESGFRVEEYVRFRDVVFDIVTPEQRELILERSQQVGVPETIRDVLKNIFAELKERENDEDEKNL